MSKEDLIKFYKYLKNKGVIKELVNDFQDNYVDDFINSQAPDKIQIISENESNKDVCWACHEPLNPAQEGGLCRDCQIRG